MKNKSVEEIILVIFSAFILSVQISYLISIFVHEKESVVEKNILINTVIFMVIQIIIIILLFVFNCKNKKINELNLICLREEKQVEYLKNLAESEENIRLQAHDIKNHLTTIRQLADMEKSNNVKDYIDELLDTYNQNEVINICKDITLNIILNRYKNICFNKNIRYYLNVQVDDIYLLDANDKNIILCNLLDNAVEAASKCSEPFVNIEMKYNNCNGNIVINISNSYNGEAIVFNTSIVFTSKREEGHGLGIKSIKKTVERNNGKFFLKADKENRIFRSIVILNQEEE